MWDHLSVTHHRITRNAALTWPPTASLRNVDESLQNVTIIIVTYESAHCIDALDSLLRHCPNIVIVDNGSKDGTPTTAQNRWQHAKVIALKSNHGFGAANNVAFAHVQTPWALLLNPDCILSRETLLRMIGMGEKFPDAAILAPQLLDPKGCPEINYRWPATLWSSKGPGADGPCCVGFVCGAAMLIRMQLIPRPAFDERFFLYYEDDDLCLRLLNQQRSIILLPDCVAFHRSRGSVRGPRKLYAEYLRGYHHAQSKLSFIEKHRSRKQAQHTRKLLLIITGLTLPIRLLLFNPRLFSRLWGRWQGTLTWRPLQ